MNRYLSSVLFTKIIISLKTMFSFKRRDDFEETKSELIFLDLSETIVLTKEDLDKTMSKIPNLKLKTDPIEQSVVPNSIEELFKVNSNVSKNAKQSVAKNLGSKKIIRKPLISDMSSESLSIKFLNPIPEPMNGLDLNDFCGTEIDWKLLTLLRPKTSSDEQYFSKLLELYKLRHKTRTEDGFEVREAAFKVSRHPRVLRYKPISFKRMDSFDSESNPSLNKIKEDITYEAYSRQPVETTQNESVIDNIDITIDDILSLTDTLDFKISDK